MKRILSMLRFMFFGSLLLVGLFIAIAIVGSICGPIVIIATAWYCGIALRDKARYLKRQRYPT